MERICPQCGHVNRTAGIFCAKCGKRLTEPPAMDAPRGRSFRPLELLSGLVQLVITVGLIALLALLLWPPELPDPVSDPAAAQSFEAAMERLLAAAEQQRPCAEAVSAQAVNAYLAARVAADESAGTASGLRVALRQIRLDFEQDRVRATADTFYGPIRIVMAVAGRPTITDQGFSMTLEETRVGRLSIPVRYGGWVAGKIRATLEGLEREREVLRRLRQIQVKNGVAQLVVAP